jgi:superfamily II RNA helicase
MLNIPNLSKDIQVDSPFQFPLDPFQKYAIQAITNDENVLVTAKTGSGKTLVGEFQIHHSLKKGKRVFYTTPIKSLSNQKFQDLKKLFPSVGIMTGDIKFMPQADIVIMTTEILRNLLFKQGTSTENIGITANLSLDNLDAVIFDEVHYINDQDRGKVWEECLTLLSPNINLVLLSATIDKPEKFAGWLGDLKQKPIHLISTEYRIVPLSHQLPDKNVVMDSKDTFNQKNYTNWYNKFFDLQNEERKHKERVQAREEGQIIKKGEHTTSFLHRMNTLISEIEQPAMFFVFSRKLCVDFAKKVSHTLIDSSDTASVRHIVKFHLHRYPELEKMAQYHELFELLQKGIAYHHSGVLPILKEIVEILFSRGFVKVLFATETFAVGINMPTKTVVFTSYRKYDSSSDRHRMLTTSEYIQMAGRAGRRGKDDKGIVIYLPIRDPEPPAEVKNMMTGKKAELNSKMKFDYSYILSSLQSGKDIQRDTYWASERNEQLKELEDELLEKTKQIMDVSSLEDCRKREELELKIKQTVNAERRSVQSELGKWQNTHMGPKWELAWKSYKSQKSLLQDIDSLKNLIEKTKDFQFMIDNNKYVLEQFGYLNGELTLKGVLASEIHEGHPLLMSYAYDEKLLHNKTAHETVLCLSTFLEDVKTEETYTKTEFHNQMLAEAERIKKIEYISSEPTFWELTSYWHEIVEQWMNGNDYVCELFGVEHGNFVKAILKLSNIVDEWINLATISKDVEIIEKMKDVRNLLVRSFVVPNSLYLQI